MVDSNSEIVLRRRPAGVPAADDFAVVSSAIPEPKDGEFLLRNLYVSLDPGIRQRLSQTDSYVKLIDLETALTSTTLGVVVASCTPKAKIGDHIIGFHTVAAYSCAIWGPLSRQIDLGAAASPSHHLSVLGPTGLTAYFGLLDVGRPQAGETVLVSAAAGAVGSIAAQIARLMGCRVVGIAGGPEKCSRLRGEFGLDAAIDYRARDLAALTAEIRAAAPDGIDIFFDNVGGIQLDAALDCLRPGARVVLCGLIAQYNSGGAVEPLTNLFKLIAKSARMEGFVVLSYADRFAAAVQQLAEWTRTGKIVFREEIHEGIDAAIPAFLRLFDGRNQGKVMVRLA